MSKERVEAFSDGVFAVALTLLILELHVPNIAGHSSLGQYAAAMAPLIPKDSEVFKQRPDTRGSNEK